MMRRIQRAPWAYWISRSLVLGGWLVMGYGLAATATAQRVQGRVVDEQGTPLPGVNVVVVGTTHGTATDDGGRYVLADLPRDTVRIAFRYVGYHVLERVADLRQRDARLDVTMQPATEALAEVRVTSERTAQDNLFASAQAQTVLDRAALEQLRGQTLGETLEHLPGLTTLTTGPSISKPVIRGLHSDRLVLLNNGVPQEGQQWGGEHAPEIDPFAPDQVEVIKGAAGVQYGVGAIGGVIRVEEAPLREHGYGGRVVLNGFSNNRQGATSLQLEGASEHVQGLAWRVRGSYRRAGDAQTPDYVLGNTAFSERNLAANLGYTRQRLALDLHVSRFATDLGIYKGSHFGNTTDLDSIIARGGPRTPYDFSYAIGLPKQAITHDVGSLRLRYDLLGGHRLNVQYGFQRNQRGEFDAHGRYSNPETPAYELILVTNTLEATFTHRPLGGLVGTVGVSAMNQGNVNGRSGYLIPNFRALTGGAFIYEKWLPNPRWTVDAGLRFDYRWMLAWPEARLLDPATLPDSTAIVGSYVRQTVDYANLTAAFGVIYAVTPTWTVALNAGSGWRPPGVHERYSNGVHHGSARYERGDPSLGPERSLDLSATLRHEGPRVSLEASAYRNRIADFIYLVEQPEDVLTIRGRFPLFRYTQNDVALQGLDGSVEVRPASWVSLHVGGSLLRADNLDLDGPLYGMPADRLRGGLRLSRAALWGLDVPYAEVEVVHVARQTRRQPGAYERLAPPPAYSLTHVSLGADVPLFGETLHLSLAVQNLFNVRYRDYLSRYRYFADEPGRNVVLRLSLPFGGGHAAH